MTKSPAAPTLGRRERNKLHKERMIREAAHHLFNDFGYETTTLRQVAEAADVGFGTVFAYATDKAGLLAMVYVERLKALPPLFDGPPRADPLDELIEGLAHLYRFWAETPSLSRHMLMQMEFYAGNPHMDLIVARRGQARADLREWLERARAAGMVRSTVEPSAGADTLFAIYTSAIREWVGTDCPAVGAGLARLRALMVPAFVGMTADA